MSQALTSDERALLEAIGDDSGWTTTIGELHVIHQPTGVALRDRGLIAEDPVRFVLVITPAGRAALSDGVGRAPRPTGQLRDEKQ